MSCLLEAEGAAHDRPVATCSRSSFASSRGGSCEVEQTEQLIARIERLPAKFFHPASFEFVSRREPTEGAVNARQLKTSPPGKGRPYPRCSKGHRASSLRESLAGFKGSMTQMSRHAGLWRSLLVLSACAVLAEAWSMPPALVSPARRRGERLELRGGGGDKVRAAEPPMRWRCTPQAESDAPGTSFLPPYLVCEQARGVEGVCSSRSWD